MAIQILMPALSPTMEEGTLAKWLVAEGDRVAAGDVIAEIETDKATMEFEAVDEGVIGKLLVAAGAEGVKVNDPIAVLLEEGEDASAADAAEASADEPAPKPEAAATAAPAASPAPPAAATEAGDRLFASPLARRLAAEAGLELTDIKGSGPRGRIVKADVEGAAAAPRRTPAATEAAATAQPAAAEAKPALPTGPQADAVKRLYEGVAYDEVKLDGMRRTVAARLTEAKQTVPHFYLRRDIHLDALLAFRADLNAALQSRDVKLSVNDFVIKACAMALQSVPDCNVAFAGDRILRFKASDVAVAVAVDGGLFTPVIRNAEAKSLSAISAEMKDLAARARSRKLAPHEYQGGAFAISNLGMHGIDNFDAVINPPQGAILAVGAGVRRPVVADDGTLAVATVMSVTLSVDHRAIDGALGAEFLADLKRGLENPLAMLA